MIRTILKYLAPMLLSTGSATVKEHLPRQERSWMERTRFMVYS